MTNKMLRDLMEEYIESLPDYDEDETYSSSRISAYYELDGFINWLKNKGYKIESLGDRSLV